MIIVCSAAGRDADNLSAICRRFPLGEVRALPWIETEESLRKNLDSNGGRPNCLFPCEPFTEKRDGDFQAFDEKLNGDAFGRMAHLVATGTPVMNEIMRCPCESPFYGKVIGADPYGYVVTTAAAQKWFPREPLSARMYAATTWFVTFDNTEEFCKVSGNRAERVRVLIASDFIPGIMTFARFYQIMSGKNHFTVSGEIPVGTPVFRHNGGYRTR